MDVKASARPLIVGIGGTARAGSSSERAVAEALRSAERLGAETRLFGGQFITGLPLYVPERIDRTDAERDFIATMRLRRRDRGNARLSRQHVGAGQECLGPTRGYR